MKPRALFHPGPMHLFWSVGVYYLHELAGWFDVTLVLRGASDEDAVEVRRVLYPRRVRIARLDVKRGFHRHRQYVRRVRRLI